MYADSAHPNEQDVIEAHAQTEHKLAMTAGYFGTYASVLAQAHKSGRLRDATRVTIVDAFAGAGLHGSADHPDGSVFGTALQAVHAAYNVQQRYPNVRVHVRLIESNPDYCDVLEARVADYLAATMPPQHRVDVTVCRGTFEDQTPNVLREIRGLGGGGYTLWFVDPYNLSPIPMSTIRLIAKARNTELVVNLDSGGLNRMDGVVRNNAAFAAQNASRLTETYGSEEWRTALSRFPQTRGRDCDSFAEAYAASLTDLYRFGDAYALRSSDSQFRHLVHFSNVPKAREKFAAAYTATQRIGLLKGRSLNERQRADFCALLHRRYRGTETTLSSLYEAQAVPLDRGQIRTVLSHAALPSTGYGTFDKRTSTFKWFNDRLRSAAMASAPRPKAEGQPTLFDISID